MDKEFFEQEVRETLSVLKSGGVILYPTDTVWGLGCDATNAAAVQRIYEIKQRPDSKSMIILLTEEREVLQYVAAPDPLVFDFVAAQERPTTIIFDQAVGLPDNLVAANGSIAIRLVRDEFCRHLIKRLKKPLVSTSANISGEPAPAFYNQVSEHILHAVDRVVRWRQHDQTPAQPSQIIKWQNNGTVEYIRK